MQQESVKKSYPPPTSLITVPSVKGRSENTHQRSEYSIVRHSHLHQHNYARAFCYHRLCDNGTPAVTSLVSPRLHPHRQFVYPRYHYRHLFCRTVHDWRNGTAVLALLWRLYARISIRAHLVRRVYLLWTLFAAAREDQFGEWALPLYLPGFQMCRVVSAPNLCLTLHLLLDRFRMYSTDLRNAREQLPTSVQNNACARKLARDDFISTLWAFVGNLPGFMVPFAFVVVDFIGKR